MPDTFKVGRSIQPDTLYSAADLEDQFGIVQSRTIAAAAGGGLRGFNVGTDREPRLIFRGADVETWLAIGMTVGASSQRARRVASAFASPAVNSHNGGFGMSRTTTGVGSVARQARALAERTGRSLGECYAELSADARSTPAGFIRQAPPRARQSATTPEAADGAIVEEWNRAVGDKVAGGEKRLEAVRAVVHERPDLHESFVAAANRQHVRRQQLKREGRGNHLIAQADSAGGENPIAQFEAAVADKLTSGLDRSAAMRAVAPRGLYRRVQPGSRSGRSVAASGFSLVHDPQTRGETSAEQKRT